MTDVLFASVSDNQPAGKPNKGCKTMDYVIGFANDPVVIAALDVLRQRSPDAETWMLESGQKLPPTTRNANIYLVGHGSPTQFGVHKNPNTFLASYPNLKHACVSAAAVIMLSCSTANEAGLIISGQGFTAATFAKNLHVVLNEEQNVIAAVGPVVVESDSFWVKRGNNVEWYESQNGWKNYKKAGISNTVKAVLGLG